MSPPQHAARPRVLQLNRFYVLPHRRHDELSEPPRTPPPLVEQSAPRARSLPDFVLQPGRWPRSAAPWSRCSRGTATASTRPSSSRTPSLDRGVAEVRALAENVFGAPDFPDPAGHLRAVRLAQAPPARRRAAPGLRHGPRLRFPMILARASTATACRGTTPPSQTLQPMRLLKRYHFIRRQQMEFLFPWPRRTNGPSAPPPPTRRRRRNSVGGTGRARPPCYTQKGRAPPQREEDQDMLEGPHGARKLRNTTSASSGPCPSRQGQDPEGVYRPGRRA